MSAHMFNQPASYMDGNTEAIPTRRPCATSMPGYTTYDASMGVTKDNWTAQVYGQNLSN